MSSLIRIMSRNYSKKNYRRHVNVHTDGACSHNGYSDARGGIGVYWDDNHPNNLSEPLFGKQTSIRAELEAATRAINQAADQGYDSITINTDSDFVIKSASDWMPNWKRKNWATSTGKTVKNKDDLIKLDYAMSRIDVSWEKVKGHSGNPGNEAADALANNGMNKHKYH